jgi:hypothetical protein
MATLVEATGQRHSQNQCGATAILEYSREQRACRAVASTAEGFVQQVAVNLLPHGYRFYVTGMIPAHKDPATVDAKLIARYGLNLSKWARGRRKKNGQARVQYLRHGRFFLLIATKGAHDFFTTETAIRDLRRAPLQCFGYSIGSYPRPDGSWRVSARIAPDMFAELEGEFQKAALRCSADKLAAEFRALPFAPFFSVRAQCFALLRLVNRGRKRAGLPLVPGECVRRERRPVRVFVEDQWVGGPK